MTTKMIRQSLILAALMSSAALCAAGELVVIGHPSAEALTKDRVSDIYLGRAQNLTPTDQSESSAIRGNFYKKLTGKDAQQIKALWARVVFTGKGQPPKEFADAAAVKKAVAADPKAIGYIDRSEVDASVKVLAVVD